MPYGPVEKGSPETPEDTAWMERCVQHVMDRGYPKDEAIAICKSQRAKSKEK